MTVQQPFAPPPPPATRRTRGRGGGIALLIVGSLIALLSFGLLAGGSVLMWADRTQRDASGYITSSEEQMSVGSYAIAATNFVVAVSAPEWHVAQDALGTVRLTATAAASGAGL